MPAAEEEEPIEVTLNIDIPKTSAPAAAGVPHITVLSVNPSWHCVFVETVQQLQTQLQAHPQQQQRIRTSIRIQFCPSPVSHGIVSRASAANANTGTTTTTTSSRTYGSHREKIQRLRTVQVISYASRQVELTRRICGHNLLKKGGIVIHLDPLSITFNEASYGFTLSLSSFVAESLSRIHSSSRSKPDELLPLTRQQNSAYCRRNLKELYYDTVSKDVVITVRPSGEVFYAHSVVLENYGYFRTLLEQAVQESGASTVLAGTTAGVGGEMHEESNIAGTSDNNGNSGNSAASQAAVDEEGYAQPLHTAPAPPPTAPQQQTCPQVRQWQQNNVDTNTRQNRVKIKIEIQDTHPNAFRAVLHYMYMGHVPTVVAPLTLGGRQQQPQQQMFATAATDFSSGQQSQTRVDTDTASASTSSSARLPPPPLRPLPSSLTPPAPEEFSWRELYEVATQFQLTGLMHLSKLVLIARLDAGLAVRELFEWAYRHWSLVPSYVSFLIENMEPDLLQWEQKHDGGPDAGVAGGSGAGRRRAASSTTSMAKSVLWPYHDRCPRFDDIMAMFLQMLNERKEARTLV
ncbi:hypothetical protein BGZ58_001908 [Dissophora ornata]|nr:hypothetical protein BGZ58_001908 [Dissophora ornata]